ncbi:MAG: hypothetical protein HRT93_10805 [Piscirickettsiaceae bacterium]|nr:hypothetical protein [Piscirickettsiaceae bacterium]
MTATGDLPDTRVSSVDGFEKDIWSKAATSEATESVKKLGDAFAKVSVSKFPKKTTKGVELLKMMAAAGKFGELPSEEIRKLMGGSFSSDPVPGDSTLKIDDMIKAREELEGRFEVFNEDDLRGELKVRMSKEELTKILEPLLDELNDSLVANVGHFVLNQPFNVTQRTDSGFRKTPMIGSERFEGLSAYMGKRDGLIVVFEVRGIDGLMEMNVGDAYEKLDGFSAFIEKVVGGDLAEESKIIKRMDERERDEVEALRVEELYGENSSFGIWG